MRRFTIDDINTAIVNCLNCLHNTNEDKHYDFGFFFTYPASLITFASGKVGVKAKERHVYDPPESSESIKKNCKVFEASCNIHQKHAIKYLILLIAKKWRLKEKNLHPQSRKSERHVLSHNDLYGRYLLLLADAFQIKIPARIKI